MAAYDWKRALRTSESDHLNWLWQYCILVYGPTRKNNYKIGCLRATKIFYDSEDNVKHILRTMRTFSRTGRACCGEGWDDLNEVDPAPCPLAPRVTLTALFAANQRHLCESDPGPLARADRVLFQALRQVVRQPHQLARVLRAKYEKQPDHLGDIALLVSIFRDKLGSTWDEIQAPSETSELLGAGIKRERVAHHLMWKTRETDLPKWVDKVIADGSLWRDPEKTHSPSRMARMRRTRGVTTTYYY